MNEAFSAGWWQVILAGVATIAIFSFLIKENPFYRLFEHLFMGVATAVGIMSTVKYFIVPDVIDPLFGLDVIKYPDGTLVAPYNSANLLLLIPMAFGSLYYCILTKRFSWLAQVVIGFSLGVGAGNAFKAVLNEMLPQLKDSFRPLYVPDNAFASLSNIIFIITLVCSMSYFFFTFKRTENGLVEKTAATGRYLMMCCFGAFFGATIMARMALLVERLDFLLIQFVPSISKLWS
jgi:4-hydroxybenzoate polyprenyltransferase